MCWMKKKISVKSEQSQIAIFGTKMVVFSYFLQKRYETPEKLCITQCCSIGGSNEFSTGFVISHSFELKVISGQNLFLTEPNFGTI